MFFAKGQLPQKSRNGWNITRNRVVRRTVERERPNAIIPHDFFYVRGIHYTLLFGVHFVFQVSIYVNL